MDAVFRALADPSRRTLLDRLADRDGQTLTELEAHLPELTRFGVMNHVRVLEEAGLVSTRKVGRFKYHYLNPVPIRLLADRWISRYAAPWTRAIATVKHAAEDPITAQKTNQETAMTDKPSHVYTVLIKATPERVWQAITDPAYTREYFFRSSVHSDWTVGAKVSYSYDDGTVVLDGEVLEVEPPHRLVTTFNAIWDDATRADPPSRVTWLLEPVGEATRLTVTHDGFDGPTATYGQVIEGVPVIVSGLKTLLETGSPLVLR
jgi:uncharacterized protein YndB with AHSA1/START domain/DNA-binding transcriptional ArsR family regulator